MPYKIPPKEFQWKKGQSGNPNGRPKGKSLKDFAREYLLKLSEEDKIDFLASLPTEIVWKMAEGNPANATDITSQGKPIIQLAQEIIEKNEINTQSESDSQWSPPL